MLFRARKSARTGLIRKQSCYYAACSARLAVLMEMDGCRWLGGEPRALCQEQMARGGEDGGEGSLEGVNPAQENVHFTRWPSVQSASRPLMTCF